MWQRWKALKRGEKVLFGVAGALMLITVMNFAIIEWIRSNSDKPMFPVRTHFDFYGDGFHGSELFRTNNCSSCHRAIGNGTNMGLDLDGVGSRHDLAYLEAFLRDPEATYITRTVEHGARPKSAAYVSELPAADRHAIAVFLSQLRADRGGASAPMPPPGKSGFIDAMLELWVPDSWRIMFSDVRDRDKPVPQKASAAATPAGADAPSAAAPVQTDPAAAAPPADGNIPQGSDHAK